MGLLAPAAKVIGVHTDERLDTLKGVGKIEINIESSQKSISISAARINSAIMCMRNRFDERLCNRTRI